MQGALLLNVVLTLHDIQDVEAFCTRIAETRRQHNPHDHEDLTAYLIEECYFLSTRYQPGGITFSTYARTTLTRRITDWLRQRHVDTRYPSNTQWSFDSYERLNTEQGVHGSDTTRKQRNELNRALPQTHRDPAAHGNPHDLVRTLRTRSSDEAWRPHIRSQTLPR
jgi:RNA polymerase sigma factor (sigma-70 family)